MSYQHVSDDGPGVYRGKISTEAIPSAEPRPCVWTPSPQVLIRQTAEDFPIVFGVRGYFADDGPLLPRCMAYMHCLQGLEAWTIATG